MPKSASQSEGLSVESLLLALLTLQIDERESKGLAENQIKTEVLLSKVGLTYQQIATMMNKNPDAVRMMLKRQAKSASKLDKEG